MFDGEFFRQHVNKSQAGGIPKGRAVPEETCSRETQHGPRCRGTKVWVLGGAGWRQGLWTQWFSGPPSNSCDSMDVERVVLAQELVQPSFPQPCAQSTDGAPMEQGYCGL